jgi:hypothetical protein
VTSYLVLRRDKLVKDGSPTGDWREFDFVNAASADAAIRAVAEAKGAGEFVAVPARSWKPRTVTVEQKTAVRLA